MVKLQNDGKHIITNLSGFFYARYTEFTWQLVKCCPPKFVSQTIRSNYYPISHAPQTTQRNTEFCKFLQWSKF